MKHGVFCAGCGKPTPLTAEALRKHRRGARFFCSRECKGRFFTLPWKYGVGNLAE